MNRICISWLPFSNSIQYTSLVSSTKSSTSGEFRNTVWDPLLIISQILSLQSFYYLSLGIWLSLICSSIGIPRSLDYVFRYEEIHVTDFAGKLIVLAFALNALTGACGLRLIVERTKLCLDFSSTTHLLHLVGCYLYNGRMPVGAAWWFLHLLCLALMCVCGEFLCMRHELKAIPVGLTTRNNRI